MRTCTRNKITQYYYIALKVTDRERYLAIVIWCIHTAHKQRVYTQLGNLNESTRGAYSTPSREGVIINELFAYIEKDRNRLN